MRSFHKKKSTTQNATAQDGERKSRLIVPSFLRSISKDRRAPDGRSSSRNGSKDLQSPIGSSKAVTGSTTVSATPPAIKTAPEDASQAPAVQSEITTSDAAAIDSCNVGMPVPSKQPMATSIGQGEAGVHDLVVGNDMWNNAFRQACARRSTEELEKLAKTADIRSIFEDLQKQDETHEKTSIFRKGVNALSPFLNGLNYILNLVQPTLSLEMSASSAVTIARMVTTVAIAVCGAAEEMQSEIETFLMYLPLIDICDAVQSGRPTRECVQGLPNKDIVHEALVSVYSDLLDFFFHCCELLKSKHYGVAITRSKIQNKISDIVSSFSKHVDVLEKSIAVATNEIVRNLAEHDVGREVRELLKPDNTKEIEHYNTLRHRANDACEWITSDTTFQGWLQVTPGTKRITLYGDMGCGKTFTVAYIIEYLRSRKGQAVKPLICSYFCKDDGEMNQVKNIYRSLLSQLLAGKTSFRWDFLEWYRGREGNTQIDPTQNVEELRTFLIRLIASLHQAMYVIIDGLDECDDEARADIDDFLTSICQNSSQRTVSSSGSQDQAGLVRVFASSRRGDGSNVLNGTETISMEENAQRDLQVVRHHTSRCLDRLSQSSRDLITNEVATKMQGCAIWGSMVIQYLRKVCGRTTGESTIKRLLQDIPPPQGLTELYARLFEKVVDKIHENRWILARSLDILAGARRQLTLRELTYSVCIEYAPSKKVKSLDEMREAANDYEGVLDLIKPFVSIAESSNSQDISTAYVRLVHQSLKQTIISWPPYEWTTEAGMPQGASKLFREAELNGLILRLCMDYLLLQEFGAMELVPDSSAQDFQATIFDFWDLIWDAQVDKWADEDLRNSAQPEGLVSFDPHAKGFGGFYTYAACYWTTHYEAATQEHMPELEDIIRLSQPGSIRAKNWLDRMRLPDWRVDLALGAAERYNPLALVAWFGNEIALQELLDQGLSALGIESEAARTAAIEDAARDAIKNEKFYVVKALTTYPTTSSTFTDGTLFVQMAHKWRFLTSTGMESWKQLLDSMVGRFQEILACSANTVLLQAARVGCLPMIIRLFEASLENQQIRNSLLQPTADDWGPIGQAGCFGHIEVVRYLCEQPGTESHLYHQDPNGDNIYHIFARNGHPEGLRALIEFFPEGVNQVNGATTPLQVAVNDSHNVEAVKVLLLEGQADINAGEPYFMPLRCAVRLGLVEMCRVLIVHGSSDPWLVVGVSELGIPFLREHIEAPVSDVLQVEQAVLREICSLMPLTVLVSLLFE